MERCKKDIVALLNVRNRLMEADKQGLWEYHFPEVAATHEEVMQIQGKLKLTLSEEYKTFLLCANGWKCFFQMVDLFGTKELISDKMEFAREILAEEMEYDLELQELKNYLLPIAMSEDDKDLFVMVLADGERFGEVIWLGGGEIERFKSFMEFFESMIKYNEGELERMLTQNS